jgi:hypothetical protein
MNQFLVILSGGGHFLSGTARERERERKKELRTENWNWNRATVLVSN